MIDITLASLEIEFTKRAEKELYAFSKKERDRIAKGIDGLMNGLSGDVKKLTNYHPEYRLRIGSYRVLFGIENNSVIVIYRISHRQSAY